MNPLDGRIALVTGASRGAGRGIALALGEAGATVYITGRTAAASDSRDEVMGRPIPGSLEETAAEIRAAGGNCVPVACDHGDDGQVARLFRQIEDEAGRLDILVNNAYQPHHNTSNAVRFWEADGPESWDCQMKVGLRSAFVASQHAARIMVRQRSGLIVAISSPSAAGYILEIPYCITKAALDRLSADMAHELRAFNVASVVVWPGALRTERVELIENITETGLHQESESTVYAGRGIAALAAEPNVMAKSGQVFTSRDLGDEYGFTDIDGSQPVNTRDRLWGPPPRPHYIDAPFARRDA